MAKKGYHTWPDGKKLHPVRKKHRHGGRVKKLKSGYQRGPSHEDGGIAGKVKGTNELIEFEGKEIIVNEGENSAASKHKKGLLGLNKNPDNYKIVKLAKKGGSVKKKYSAGTSVKTYSSGGYVEGK